MLHVNGGGFSTYGSITSLWFTFWGLFCMPQLWSLPFVSFSLPFLGVFFLQSLARFHHHHALKAPWLCNAIVYLMSLQVWGGGKLHVTRYHVIGDMRFAIHKFSN